MTMQPAAQPVLEARGLSLTLIDRGAVNKVVDDVSMRIGEAEFFGLIGESGSGKTMIARAIMRLMPPSRLRIGGSLTLMGVDVAAASEAAMQSLRGKTAGMIFQEPMTSLNPIMTVEQQVCEAMAAHAAIGAKERREKIRRLLREVRFDDAERVASLYPHELSGGMRQRVMIAMALANEPKLLIADEPTTALDVTIQQEVMDILVRLCRSRGLAVLFISHDLALVNRYADRIGVLYGGVLMEVGAAQDVIRRPAHPYTAALLSCMPRRRDGRRQIGIEGTVPRIDSWFDGCRFAPRCANAKADCTAGAIALVSRGDGRSGPNTQSVRCLHPLE